MSNKNTENRNHKPSKLSFNRETLRTLSGDKLDQVVGGFAGPGLESGGPPEPVSILLPPPAYC